VFKTSKVSVLILDKNICFLETCSKRRALFNVTFCGVTPYIGTIIKSTENRTVYDSNQSTFVEGMLHTINLTQYGYTRGDGLINMVVVG
jgi:hypothetical protein